MVNGARVVLGMVLLVVVGCADATPTNPTPDDAAAVDARVTDAPPTDARIDAPPIDARPIDARPIDARPIDATVDAAIDASTMPTTCDPLAPPAQAGCPAGNKCTWISLQETPDPIGILGCVPAGNVPINGACVEGAPGLNTGYDNCVAGAICIGGTCQDVCGFGAGVNDACPSGQACTRYNGRFANPPDDPIAGACRPTCDPILQNTCGLGQGCYVLVSATTSIAVCAGAGSIGHGQVIVGQAFANSCLPGHQPRRRDPVSATIECGALCRPADVTSTTNMVSEGGVAPATCIAKGAAAPGTPGTGESCRYWWAREPFTSLSPYSNTLGWCFKHAAFQYDSNLDGTTDAPYPRCINLTTGDVVPPIGNPPHNDAQYFWCVTINAMLAKAAGHGPPAVRPAEPALDRLAP